MSRANTTTYSVKVTNTPTPIAPYVAPGPKGEMDGRIEFQNMSLVAIEISTDPDFAFGEGMNLSAAPSAGDVGQSYEQSNNPDPHEWYARTSAAGTNDIRVHDTRRARQA